MRSSILFLLSATLLFGQSSPDEDLGSIPDSALEATLNGMAGANSTEPVPALPAAIPVQASPAKEPDRHVRTLKAEPGAVAKLAPVPGREPVHVISVSRAESGAAHFNWENTPITTAFDELSRLRDMRIQYVGGKDYVVNGDYRNATPLQTLQAILNQTGLTVVQTGGVYVITETPTKEMLATEAANKRAAILVNEVMNRSYEFPYQLLDRVKSIYQSYEKPGFNLAVLPRTAASTTALVRITATKPAHSGIERNIALLVKNYAPAKYALTEQEQRKLNKLLAERDSIEKQRDRMKSHRGW